MLENIINQRPFKSLGYYAQQHSKFMTKEVRSANFRPCLYDVYDRSGKIIYKAGETPSVMFAWDWDTYQSDKTNLTDWSADFSSIAVGTNIPSKNDIQTLQDEQKVRRAQLDMMKKTNWTSLGDEEMGKALVTYTKLDSEIRTKAQQLWCMKAKRLGYYNDDGTININQVIASGFQDELQYAESDSVTTVMEKESAEQKENQGNPNK